MKLLVKHYILDSLPNTNLKFQILLSEDCKIPRNMTALVRTYRFEGIAHWVQRMQGSFCVMSYLIGWVHTQNDSWEWWMKWSVKLFLWSCVIWVLFLELWSNYGNKHLNECVNRLPCMAVHALFNFSHDIMISYLATTGFTPAKWVMYSLLALSDSSICLTGKTRRLQID